MRAQMRSAALPARPAAGLALGALLLGAACIGLSPIFVRVSETGPLPSAFWRVALAAPLLWLLAGARPAARGLRPLMLVAGAAFAADLAFWHTSIELTSVANSTLLANLASIFVTLGAWALWHQRPTRMFLLGLLAALGGVMLLVRASIGFSATTLLGDGLGAVTAVFYAAYLLTVKTLRERGTSTAQLMAMVSSVSALILLPVALASGQQMLALTAAGWLKLLGLALVSQIVGQGLIAYALALLPAAFSSVSLLLQPVMAALFAWVLLGEPMAPLQIAAAVVVLAGIYLARRGSLAPAAGKSSTR